MKQVKFVFAVFVAAFLLSPFVLGSVVFAAQPSLEIGNVLVTTNECEEISGSFTVSNAGEVTGTNTQTLAILQAHVPPAFGGQAQFFPIAQVVLDNQDIAAGETQTRNFSITGFTIPENTNSIRVEIQVVVAGRDNVFLSRSESFKPSICGVLQDPPRSQEPKIPSEIVPEQPRVITTPGQVAGQVSGPAILPVTGINGGGFGLAASPNKNTDQAKDTNWLPIISLTTFLLGVILKRAGWILVSK